MIRALLTTSALILVLSISGCGGAEDVATDGNREPKAAAPGVPVGAGDDSIQTWGREGSSPERAEAAAFVQAYLDARVARDGEEACAHLAASTRASLSRLYGGVDCPAAIESLGAEAGTRALAEEADIEVLSFRIGGGYAFLIYRRGDGIFATPIEVENGALKVVSVGPTPIA